MSNPVTTGAGVRAKVIAGRAHGVEAVIGTHTPLTLVDYLEQIRSWWKSQLRERMTDTYATYDEILRALCNALGAPVDDRTLCTLPPPR